MRIALFGGTFDPPHRGHLSIATAAADAFHLDSILFAPAGRQPLKAEDHSSPFSDRLAMTALACANDPRFQPSTLDAPRPDGLPNFTVDALAQLRAERPGDLIFNLVGADSFLLLPHWHQPARLLELAEWIVVSRPGFPLDGLPLLAEERSRVHFLQTVHEDVAATTLRERLSTGDPCHDLLPETVSSYALTHHLYK
jgi:nicotinate-nucleotide adenylyltransferase